MKRILSLFAAAATLALCSCHTTGSSCCATGACAAGAHSDKAAVCKTCGKPAAACACKIGHKH